MSIKYRQDLRYPSVMKPGVFKEVTEIVGGVDVLAEKWQTLTGIDEQEIDKFKFALGTWVQMSRRKRRILILPPGPVSEIAFGSGEGEIFEPKPTQRPAGFPYDIYEWANDKEELLEQANSASDDVLQSDFYTAEDENGANRFTIMDSDEYRNDPNYGPGLWLFNRIDGLLNNNFNEVKKKGSGDKPYAYIRERRVEGLGFTNSPEWYDKIKVGTKSPNRAWKCTKRKRQDNFGSGDYIIHLEPNISDSKWNDELRRGKLSPLVQYEWKPSLSLITDPQTGLSAYGEWVEGGGLVHTETQAKSNNVYVGVVTNKPITNFEEIKEEDLFLYHDIGSDNYKDASAPLKVFFSMNLYEGDTGDRNGVLKYVILEWGDEKEKIKSENLLNSEFFFHYENEDGVFDYIKYKKLCLLIENGTDISKDEVNESFAERGTLLSHVYTEPGVKTIKTMVMRLNNDGDELLETYEVHTNIFIADPNQTIQDFNIFGADEFTVLPLENELEPIIGNIDERSEYVRSIKKIENNDLYESTDYLEKLYADDFLPKVSDKLYGEYAGNLDLGITRVFKKPYNIFDFIGGDAIEIISNNFEFSQDSLPKNSSATEILISNEDCLINLDPSNQTTNQIENTGNSDEKGILMGDYRLVKNPNQKIRKDDSMSLPRINTQRKRQAF